MSADRLQALDGILAEIFREGPLISTTAVSSSPVVLDQTGGDEPEPKPGVVEAPPDAAHAVMMAEQAKSVLAGLNLDTAIRLRWVLRDIKAKRTKLSPISPNDLAALIDLELVRMHEGAPMLTLAGDLVLD